MGLVIIAELLLLTKIQIGFFTKSLDDAMSIYDAMYFFIKYTDPKPTLSATAPATIPPPWAECEKQYGEE